VPDNLKSGVTSPCRYEPDINPTYQDLAEYYGTAVIPARSRKPKDKAKVETGVLIVERWILAALRNHTFFSIAELNKELSKRLVDLNSRQFQKLDGNRKSLFLKIDQPALQPIPATAYEYAQWKKARVNIDYHIEIMRHYYSVPYQLARQQVDSPRCGSTCQSLIKNILSGPLQGLSTGPGRMAPKSRGLFPISWNVNPILNRGFDPVLVL
jgi:transposase